VRKPFVKEFYPEHRFGGFTRLDGTVNFYFRVNALLQPEFTVLDLGCGRGQRAEKDINPYRKDITILRGKVARVIGIDVDPVGAENPCIDEFRLIDGPQWPIEDAEIDLIVSDCVLEHIEKVDAYFQECWRVLKPGGFLCIRTANAWGYVGIAARLIPNRLHARVVGKVQDSRKEQDVFPTVYRCNSRRRLRRTLMQHGFDAAVYGYEAEPSYLSFNKFAYWLATLHAKLAPEAIQLALFAFARKTA